MLVSTVAFIVIIVRYLWVVFWRMRVHVSIFVLTYRSYKHCIKKKKLKKIFFKFKVGVSLYCKKGKETI